MLRRNSGEILNATLVEVFVVLVFLVLLVLHHTAKGSQEGLDRLNAELARLERELADSEGALKSARRYQLLYLSEHPGDCHAENVPLRLIEARVTHAGTIRVRQLASFASLPGEGELTLAPDEFRRHFAPLWRYSDANRCRFVATVTNEPDIPVDAFKRANAAVSAYFRVHWR